LVIHMLPVAASAKVTSVKVPPTSMASVHDAMSELLGARRLTRFAGMA
jgi:hypothetical protein